MLDCSAEVRDPFRCPSKWELFEQLLANMPPGRAYQTAEAPAERTFNPVNSMVGEFEVSNSGLGVEPDVEHLTVQEQWLAAFAELLEYVHTQACAMLAEMHCDTTQQLLGDWQLAFGFPDECEPYSSLCAKVHASGGATLAFLRDLVARAGFIAVIDDASTDPLLDPNTIRVRTAADPDAPIPPVYEIGEHWMVGCMEPCPPGTEAVVCLVELFKPAHVSATYEEL